MLLQYDLVHCCCCAFSFGEHMRNDHRNAHDVFTHVVIKMPRYAVHCLSACRLVITCVGVALARHAVRSPLFRVANLRSCLCSRWKLVSASRLNIALHFSSNLIGMLCASVTCVLAGPSRVSRSDNASLTDSAAIASVAAETYVIVHLRHARALA